MGVFSQVVTLPLLNYAVASVRRPHLPYSGRPGRARVGQWTVQVASRAQGHRPGRV